MAVYDMSTTSSANHYAPTVTTTATTYQYLDTAMDYLLRSGKFFVEAIELIQNNLHNLARFNGLLHTPVDIPNHMYDEFGYVRPTSICYLDTAKGLDGMSVQTLANHGCGNATLSYGYLHAKRIELICSLADLYLCVDIPYVDPPTATYQAGKKLTGAAYPEAARYPTAEITLAELKAAASTIDTYIHNMENTYYTYAQAITPFCTYAKTTKQRRDEYGRNRTEEVDSIVITPDTDETKAALKNLHDTMIMSSTRTGLLHTQRMELLKYLAALRLYCAGTVGSYTV